MSKKKYSKPTLTELTEIRINGIADLLTRYLEGQDANQ